jgi:hypothetical protein
MKFLTIIALAAVGSAVYAADGDWKLGASFDLYYQTGFSGSGNFPGRAFDFRRNQFTLGSAIVRLRRDPTSKSPYGVTLDLGGGDTIDSVNALEPGGNSKYKGVQQGYVTYAGDGFTLDFGKFNSWVGYEATLPADNANYSRSQNWTFGQPAYFTGLRLGLKNGVTVYATQGWNEVEDSNSGKTFGASLSGRLSPSTTGALNLVYGDEGRLTPAPKNTASFGGAGFASPGSRKLAMANAYLVHTQGEWTMALDASYADADGSKWYGVAGYATKKLDAATSVTGRLEGFRDADGIRTGASQSFYSGTVTYARDLDSHSQLRLEFRHDRSSQPFYGGKSTQNTLGAALLFKF